MADTDFKKRIYVFTYTSFTFDTKIRLMEMNVFNEASRIWDTISKNNQAEDLAYSLELHKRLLSFFQVGDYYYYIFNVKETAFDFMSNEIKTVLGYEPGEVDVPLFLSKIHPEDQPWFLNFENKLTAFFATLTHEQIPNYKVRYDYRIQKKNGDYIRILQQVVTIETGKDNGIIRTLGMHTDITHIKQEGIPVLSFIGLNGEPSYLNVDVQKVFSLNGPMLTEREKEILNLLIEGKTSMEIGRQLFIAKTTVDTHRKNILQKTNCSNTAALISATVKKGWL